MGAGMLLAFLCGLGWASADVLRKQLAAQTDPLLLSIRLSIVQCVIVVFVALMVLVPARIEGWSEWQVESEYWAFAIPGFICTAAGHFLFIKALRTSELSLTIPFLSFSPIFVMVIGAVLLTEWPSTLAGLGVVVVALGAVFLRGRGQAESSTVRTQSEERAFRRGRGLMLATAAVWSTAAVLDKGAIAHSSPLSHLILLLAATWALLALYAACFTQRSETGSQGLLPTWFFRDGWLWASSAVMVGSLALQLGAYAYWDVAYVEAFKRAVGLVCSVVFGALIFKEGDAMRRLPAVVAMAIGSACVLLGS